MKQKTVVVLATVVGAMPIKRKPRACVRRPRD